jgi:hypothetical protein
VAFRNLGALAGCAGAPQWMKQAFDPDSDALTVRTCKPLGRAKAKGEVTNDIYMDGPVDFVLHWGSPYTSDAEAITNGA